MLFLSKTKFELVISDSYQILCINTGYGNRFRKYGSMMILKL